MTVSSIEPVNNYAGNNSATKFDFDFLIESENELLVQHTNKAGYQTTLKLNTDYTINEIGSENGSYIIFPVRNSEYKVLQEDEVLTLSLNLKIVQEKEFKNSNKLSLKMLEGALDYITRLIQILNRKMERAVKVKEGINIAPDELIGEINEAVNQSLNYSLQSEENSDEAKRNAQTAKEWAIKENDKVQETDFSSKYYAQKSKQCAEQSEEKAQETNQMYLTAKEDIQNKANEKLKEIIDEGDKQFERIQSAGIYQKDGKIYYLDESGNEKSINIEKADNLFDLIQKDHVLTFEEKEGYEQLGEYVYKEAADGRYGYPDFYDKCLEEYKDENNTKESVYLSDNIIVKGSLTDNKGIISGFGAGNTALTKAADIGNLWTTEDDTISWEIVLKVKMPDTAVDGAILGCSDSIRLYALSLRITAKNLLTLYVSGNGTSWNICNALASTLTFESGKEYLIRVSYSITGEDEDKTAAYNVDLSENIDEDEKVWTNYIKKEITGITSASDLSAVRVNAAGISFLSLGNDYDAPFTGGIIDLNKSYYKIVNPGKTYEWHGINTVEVTKNANGHVFYDVSIKDSVDKIYGREGSAWYYGIDETEERIFLPRITERVLTERKEPSADDPSWYNLYSDGYCEQGGHAVTNKATTAFIITFLKPFKSADYSFMQCQYSTGDDYFQRIDITKKLKTDITVSGQNDSAGFDWIAQGYTDFSANLEKHTYMVVGNTSVKKAQSEFTEVTASENDTLPLFTGMYFDFKPNHASWIKAGTIASGSVYESAYNELVKIAKGEETKYGDGFKVINESEKDDRTDYSEYWIINQDEQTFRTPLKTSLLNAISNARILVKKKEPSVGDPVWYNLYSDGWLEQGGDFDSMTQNGTLQINLLKSYKDTQYLIFTQQNKTTENNNGNNNSFEVDIYGSTKSASSFVLCEYNYGSGGSWETKGYTDPPAVEEIADSENIGLYFKAANAVEDLQLLDAGQITQTLNDIGAMTMRECAVVIESHHDTNHGFRLWSDGWCEQYGRIARSDTGGIEVTFLKTFKDTGYSVEVIQEALESYTTLTSSYNAPYIANKTVKGMTVCSLAAVNQIRYFNFTVKGYIG